jgi:acyl-CoA synthetase (AMP-forming)/AMP-acid ligase II
MSYNLSELIERITDGYPDRDAVVTPSERLTYADLDARANQLAHHLRARGIGEDDNIGLQLRNGSEYLIGMLAAFKIRAVPVNINFRYVQRELADLYARMDVVATLVHREFAPAVASVRSALPKLRHVILVDDASGADLPDAVVPFDDAIAGQDDSRDFSGRSSDDRYIACTGGTTGLPKGVVWRHEDLFFGTLGGGDPARAEGPVSSPEELVGRVMTPALVHCVTPPLIHVSAHWAALTTLLAGGTVVLTAPGSFSPTDVWQQVAAEKAVLITLVGDAMLRPLLDAYEAEPVDVSNLMAIASGGVAVSATSKQRAHQVLPAVIVIDGYGSTETGVAGTSVSMQGSDPSGPSLFDMDENTTVLDDDHHKVEPGSGVVGRLARRGRVPIGYYNDPETSARTFVTVDGTRWVLPGDLARVEADGKISLLGRGSTTINTGGEKVFPDEVESALRELPAISDVIVVGVEDPRWGQKIVAVASVTNGELTLELMQAHARERLAGYKIPRALVVVDRVMRLENGKPDYAWARQQARAADQGQQLAGAGAG